MSQIMAAAAAAVSRHRRTIDAEPRRRNHAALWGPTATLSSTSER